MSVPNPSETGDTGRRFVQVPVPEEYVVQVMAYIGSLDAGTPAQVPSTPPPPTALADARVAAWSVEGLTRLASGENFTTRLLTDVMDVLADHPGDWMDTTALADATGQERQTLKGIWTHVGRHVKHRYPGHPWPLDAKWGPQISAEHPAVTFYRLSPEQAKRWKEVRKASPQ